MAKVRTPWNDKTFHKRLNEGRGFGEGLKYLPFIQIHDFASNGTCSRVLSETVGRVHHLFSKNELAFFYILDFDSDVIDIREQFPLLDPDDPHDLCKVVGIAESAGIRYPRCPKNGYPYVQTSDFVVTTKSGLHVYSVKESKEFTRKRVRELQELERRYWLWRGIPWSIMTEHEICYAKAHNIQWIYHARDISSLFPERSLCEDVMDFEKNQYETTEYSIVRIARNAEDCFKLDPGLGLTAFQRLLFEKKMIIPLEKPLDITTPRLYHGKERGWYSCLEVYQ